MGIPEKKSKQQLKIEQTKGKIIDSYINILENKPYDKITVVDIAQSAHITRTTFYMHFQNVSELTEAIESEMASIMTFYKGRRTFFKREIDPMTPDQSVVDWFAHCRTNRRRLLALLGPNGSPHFESKLKKKMSEGVNRMMDNEELPNDELRPYYVELLVNIHLTLMHYWLVHDEENSLTPQAICHMANLLRVGSHLGTQISRSTEGPARSDP